MNDRIAIVNGVRTPQCKAGGVLNRVPADDLAARVIRELVARADITADMIDEVIMGNVAQPAQATNVARVAALKAGLAEHTPAYTVQRNCASGAESIIQAAAKIRRGELGIVIAGGTESMSNMPLLYSKPMTEWLARLQRARSFGARLALLKDFRPRFLKPVVGLIEGLTDPICGLIMGKTAEVLAREFQLTREEQDAYALLSQQRASQALRSGRFSRETMAYPVPPAYTRLQQEDDGVRHEQTAEALAKLLPYFDRYHGTVTVGNSSQLTDGACALLLMAESRAHELGLEPLGYLRAAASAGLAPARMGLGPAYATARLLKQSGMTLQDFDLIELNEAFAAVVLANERAFDSRDFARRYLDRDEKLGSLDRDRVNVNGGAIALGHPVGATGARLVLTLLHELKERSLACGLATMCVGGGQGTSLALEAA